MIFSKNQINKHFIALVKILCHLLKKIVVLLRKINSKIYKNNLLQVNKNVYFNNNYFYK